MKLSPNIKVSQQSVSEEYALYQGDSVELSQGLPDNSIDFTIFSPPFSTLYIYSDSYADMGNCASDEEFFVHFLFLIDQLLRVTKPGRLCAVHCKNMPLYKTRDGVTGLKDFRGDIIRAFTRPIGEQVSALKGLFDYYQIPTDILNAMEDSQKVEGAKWVYHTEVVIDTDPVFERARTNTQKLLYGQLKKDSSHSGVGTAEYVVVFRKWTEDYQQAEPIEHWESYEELKKRKPNFTPKDEKMIFPLSQWQKWAAPVWNDIRRMDVLNVRQAKNDKDEKHICPLQLEVIRRALRLWSNPGDVILDPFAGLFSTGHVAIEEDRIPVGFELKEEYFKAGNENANLALSKRMTLF